MVWPSREQLVGYIPSGEPANLRTLYLASWFWIVNVAHYQYDNIEGNRCGENGFVDCSGGSALAMNIAHAALGLPLPYTCEATNSYTLAADCYNTPRPQWLTDRFGDGQGTFIPLTAAQDQPAVLGFHGSDFGRGPDSNGDGHVKTAYYGHNVSVEAMSHSMGVGFSTFLNGNFIEWAAVPPLLLEWFAAPSEEDLDVICVQCPTRPALNGDLDQPYAVFVPPNGMFPIGGAICHNGARINNDLPVAGNQSIFVPTLRPGGNHWVTMCAKPTILVRDAKGNVTGTTSKGVTFIDDKGQSSGVTAGFWA